ncbi:MAG: bacteriocin, partial [Desulfovibrio sp.]|nr:bacteriocin [Desulfovibrio sp.]
MPVIPEGIAYAYTHETTQATTGYFSCQPPASLTLPQALARLEATPFDDFLRQHCLRQLSRRSPEEIKNLADELYDRETDSFRRMGLAGLLLECSLLVPELAHCCDGFPEDALQRLTLSSSLIYLRAASRKDFGLMQAWSAHFADNIARHHMLPHWEELELELPYS